MRKTSKQRLQKFQPHVSLFVFRAQKSASGLGFQKKGFSDSSFFLQNRRPVQDSLSTVRLNGVSPSVLFQVCQAGLPPPLMLGFHHTQFVIRSRPRVFFVLARHCTNRLSSTPNLLLSGFDIFLLFSFFPSFGWDFTTQPKMPLSSSVLVLQAQAYPNTWLGTKC